MSLPRRFVPMLVTLFLAWLCACNGAPAAPPKAPAEALVVGTGGTLPVAAGSVSEGDGPIPVSADDPIDGHRLAYVTVVVFSDFQCPFCSRLTAVFKQVRETYGDDVRFVFKHNPLPFHQHARLAAEVGAGVLALQGSEAFWRYHDTVFAHQRDLSPEKIRVWAAAAGADPRAIEDGISRKTWGAKVDRDAELAARIDANGTPSSFINGTLLSGAQPFAKFKETIDAALKDAKLLAIEGTPRDRIYARAVAANFRSPTPRGDANDANDAKDDDDKPDTSLWKVPVVGSPVRGPSTALVTIVEFSDFQCPFCKKVQTELDRVRTEYGDRVRIVWKDQPLPFHPRAAPAAQLARAARAQKGDAGFFAMHDRLFDAQSDLDDAVLTRLAREAGLDVAKAMAAVNAKSFAKIIDADANLADSFHANGTPHFFVNGRRFVGAQPFEKWKALIDTEMAKAESLVRSGVPKTAVYDAIIKDGKGAPDPERRTVSPSVGSAPFRGAANAKVVIQEFSDFQCPFCSRVEPTLDQLLKDYPGQIKLVWRNLPLAFHADADLAAQAAREAFTQKHNQGFSKMRELLFKHQHDTDGLKRPALEQYAAEVGLDASKFAKALDDGTHKAAIQADLDAARDAGISGTPSFVVGPYYVGGAQPLAKFKALVDRVLSEPAAALGKVAAVPAGLLVTDVKVGSGAAVKIGDTVSVHYVGTLGSGTEFDSSRKRGVPFSFAVGAGHVIKGWDSGLVGMKVGGVRKLTIPPSLAYGDRGAGAAVPPNSTLQFELELLSIK